MSEILYSWGVIRTIENGRAQDLIVAMEYLAADVALWLYTHWWGRWEIGIENRKVLEESLGDQINTLTILVMNSCCVEGSCENLDHFGNLSIGVASANPFETLPVAEALYEGTVSAKYRSRHPTGSRSKLYDFSNYGVDFLGLDRMERITAQRTAQHLLRSFLEVRVKPDPWGRISLTVTSDADGTPIRSWVRRFPGLLQGDFGGDRALRPLFDGSTQGSSYPLDDDKRQSRFLIDVCPELMNAMNVVQPRCKCGCKASSSGMLFGCLQTVMFNEILLFLAHGLVDSAGVQDISNLRARESEQSLIHGTTMLMNTLAQSRRLSWTRWFRLAASAATGIPLDLKNNPELIDLDEFESESIAWTAGSMTVVPHWLDFDRRVHVQHSWGVKILHGALANVQGEKAIIQGIIPSERREVDTPVIRPIAGAEDDVEVSMISSVISSDGLIHRLMTLARTNSSMRIIDLGEIYRGAMLARPVSCAHATDSVVVDAHPWFIDDIVQGWDRRCLLNSGKEHPHVAISCNDPVRANIVIGLHRGDCVIQDSQCCLSCLVDNARAYNAVAVCTQMKNTTTSQRKKRRLLTN